MSPWPKVVQRRSLRDFPPPTPQPTPCRLWQGAVNRAGYGTRGKRLVHRWVWEQINGPVPKGMVVMHLCDNPPCFRYDHLFLGTQADNLADMDAKGRRVPREGFPEEHRWRGGNPKLTEEQVLAIRADTRTQHEIATDYGISQSQVSNIRLRRQWRRLDENQPTERTDP